MITEKHIEILILFIVKSGVNGDRSGDSYDTDIHTIG